jgi:hypothetical protein
MAVQLGKCQRIENNDIGVIMKANHENNEKRNGVSMAWHQSAEGNVFNQ